MQINKLLQPSVGADLSRTPPIYRPLLAVPLFRFICETSLSALLGRCDGVRIYYSICIIAPLHLLSQPTTPPYTESLLSERRECGLHSIARAVPPVVLDRSDHSSFQHLQSPTHHSPNVSWRVGVRHAEKAPVCHCLKDDRPSEQVYSTVVRQ